MNDFTASNGIEIRITTDLGGDKYLHGTVPNEVDQVGFTPELHATASEKGLEALREFFQAEADERLGRWRWPENPNYVVYIEDGYAVVVDEAGPKKTPDRIASRHLEDPVGSIGWGEFAARAYFDAHPEPKPWHDAKPGEVWELTLEGEKPAAFYPSKSMNGYFTPVMPNTGTTAVNFDWPLITAGRRIWPEVSS
ncbi:hypothetical protein [Microbacterium sp. Leaf436]|uniref:hypothetical protein n=1 Tax=Microbacterium sp. Leaf436 TaxID=1736377 RepID=UPI0006FE6089|nr:hypothetical protein [Microbacterium sp. Leaf436]KQT75374.1 hypothetical protein ASG45_02420 [Microbacterium sp. Leaf436]